MTGAVKTEVTLLGGLEVEEDKVELGIVELELVGVFDVRGKVEEIGAVEDESGVNDDEGGDD